MMNQHQLQAYMFDLVNTEGLTVDSAFERIRRDHRETFKLASRPMPNGQGNSLEFALANMKKDWDNAYGPVAREYMKLTNTELKLRGDITFALYQLTSTDPRDVREVIRVVQVLNDQNRETWMGAGQPPYLVEAIELLEAGKVDCAGLRAALDGLYPAAKPDADE